MATGTHHSKAIVVIRPGSLTVSVVTANFIFSDWKNKTNGVWTESFPCLPIDVDADAHAAPPPPPPGFGADLAEYYRELRSLALRPSPSWTPQPAPGGGGWASLRFDWVGRYDYSRCNARLVAAVPGRHVGESLSRWGGRATHSALRPHRAPPLGAPADSVHRVWHTGGGT